MGVGSVIELLDTIERRWKNLNTLISPSLSWDFISNIPSELKTNTKSIVKNNKKLSNTEIIYIEVNERKSKERLHKSRE